LLLAGVPVYYLGRAKPAAPAAVETIQ
jgi:hypothetical protein